MAQADTQSGGVLGDRGPQQLFGGSQPAVLGIIISAHVATEDDEAGVPLRIHPDRDRVTGPSPTDVDPESAPGPQPPQSSDRIRTLVLDDQDWSRGRHERPAIASPVVM